MDTKKLVEKIKANKRTIIKTSLIVLGTTAGIILTVVLLKKDRDTTDETLQALDAGMNVIDSAGNEKLEQAHKNLIQAAKELDQAIERHEQYKQNPVNIDREMAELLELEKAERQLDQIEDRLDELGIPA